MNDSYMVETKIGLIVGTKLRRVEREEKDVVVFEVE